MVPKWMQCAENSSTALAAQNQEGLTQATQESTPKADAHILIKGPPSFEGQNRVLAPFPPGAVRCMSHLGGDRGQSSDTWG